MSNKQSENTQTIDVVSEDVTIEEYTEAVNYFAEQKDDMLFTNKGKDHAAIVLCAMLKNAEGKVDIFSGSLNRDVADDTRFLDALKEFIDSGKTLRVLLESDIPTEPSKALNMVMDAAKKSKLVQYKTLKEEDKEKMSKLFKDGQLHHFAVADRRALRLETDAIDFKALVSFNDPEYAGSLQIMFNEFFK